MKRILSITSAIVAVATLTGCTDMPTVDQSNIKMIELITVILATSFVVGLNFVVGSMARQRYRQVALWVIFNIILSVALGFVSLVFYIVVPLLFIMLLFNIGPNKHSRAYIVDHIKEKAEQKPKQADAR